MAGFSLPSALLTGQTILETEWAKMRDSLIANAHAAFALGGSRSVAIPNGGGWMDADAAIEFQLPSSSYGGAFVWKVVVEVVTETITTTVTPRLYNVTDAVAVAPDGWTGSAGTATAWGSTAEQVSSALTIATGTRYRLQFSKSDDAVQCWGLGYLRRTAS